jgi:branched-chain amino acid transport system permease protein
MARVNEASRWSLVLPIAAIGALAFAPFFVYPIFLAKVLCFALFAASFNLLLGYAGLLSFGHASFFGGAAYVAGHAAKIWGFNALASIAVGTLFSAVLGVALGFIAIRRRGIYFAMITLALSQLVYFVLLQAPFTHGEDGIQNIPRGSLFGLVDLASDTFMYYFVLIPVAAAFLAIWRLINSPFGQILQSIRENEIRAVSLGYRVERYKLGVFVISAALAGLAGALKVIVFQFASLADIDTATSTDAIVMSLLGGLGTSLGPIVGAIIVVAMNSYFASWNFPVTVIIGTIFRACVMVFRKGVVGETLAFLKGRADDATGSGGSPRRLAPVARDKAGSTAGASHGG